MPMAVYDARACSRNGLCVLASGHTFPEYQEQATLCCNWRCNDAHTCSWMGCAKKKTCRSVIDLCLIT